MMRFEPHNFQQGQAMPIKADTTSGTVTLDISGSYTPDQLLTLVKDICAARAQVAKDPAKPGDIWVAPKAGLHTQLMNGAGPDTLLAMNFPGIGWIGMTLSTPVRAQLISLLATQQSVVVNAPANNTATAEASMQIKAVTGGTTLH